MANIQEIKSIIRKMMADEKARKTSIAVWGPPGVGKTSLFEQVAEECGANLAIYLAATMDPTDVVGCPHPLVKSEKDQTGITVFFPPFDLWKLTDHPAVPEQFRGPTVACFDDVSAAYDQVFAALYRLFQQHQVAGCNIRDNVLLCATGNRAEDKAAAKDLPTALNNRFIHIDFDLSPEAWREWAINSGISKEIVGYIGARPNMLHDPDFAARNERAFVTPRSVEMADTMVKAMGGIESSWFTAVKGCVGEAWATEFQAYLKNSELLVPPKEIIKAPKTCKVPGKADIDVIHATISTLTYFLINDPSMAGCRAAMTYSLRIPHPEMGMVLCRDVLTNVVLKVKDGTEGLSAGEFKAKVTNSPETMKVLEKYGDYLN